MTIEGNLQMSIPTQWRRKQIRIGTASHPFPLLFPSSSPFLPSFPSLSPFSCTPPSPSPHLSFPPVPSPPPPYPPSSSLPLSFPSPSLRSRAPLFQLGSLGERCKLLRWGLGRNRFWCILTLKSDIWWQQFQ